MEKLLLSEENDWIDSKLWINVVINKINDYFNNPTNNINNINITGKWGSGKTTIAYNVIENLKKEINSKFFSLWEYEIDSNPYLKIMLNLITFFEIKINEEIIKKLKLNFSLGLTLFGFLNVNISSKEKNKKDNNYIFEEIGKNNQIETIIDLINQKTKDKKYLIVLDELDRCTPNKIPEFLSIIKNLFFKLKNVYFIVCSNNDAVNSIIQNSYSSNMQGLHLENEKYTDKIFEQSVNLNSFLNLKKLPPLMYNNNLIMTFFKKMKIIDLRLINKLFIALSKWSSENLEKYFSVWNYKEKRISRRDMPLDVKYFYLFYFYFLKNYKEETFTIFIEKINNYISLENKGRYEENDLDKISLSYPRPIQKYNSGLNPKEIKNFQNQNNQIKINNIPIYSSFFFVSIEENNLYKQISGFLFDFLTKDRKHNLNFELEYKEKPCFYLKLDFKKLQQTIDEQINIENKFFLEIFKNSDYDCDLWNIDFENLKKIIFEYILLDHY